MPVVIVLLVLIILAELFLLMRPFNDFFNEAVMDFQYPVREN